MNCDKCEAKSKITLGYGPHHFCEEHFTKFFEARFKKTIRKYKLLKSGEKILVAVSGGKDSVLLLHLLHKFYSDNNYFEALIIDEGVSGYRDKSVKVAKNICKKLKIKETVVSFEDEFGITNDEAMPILKSNNIGGTCAYCGTWRRKLMNKYARELNFDKLATGHNLDDEAQSVVMNVFNNDFEKFSRTGSIGTNKSFTNRIKPLYKSPEKEIIAYCAFNNISHYSQECCPYSYTAKRNEYRDMLNNFENRFPGTKYSIIRFFEEAKSRMKPVTDFNLVDCKDCGEPTTNNICKSCSNLKKIKSHSVQKNTIKIGSNKNFNKALTCSTTKSNAS